MVRNVCNCANSDDFLRTLFSDLAAKITLYFQIHKFSEDYFRYLSPHKVLEAKKEKRKPDFRFSILIFGELAPIPSICPHDYRSFPLNSVTLRPK